MRYLAEKLIQSLSRHTIIDESKQDIYIYAADLLLYTIISTLGLVIISAAMRKLCEGIIIIFIYYVNQTIGGGFHASTHLRCFLTMAVGLIVALFMFDFHPSYPLIYLMIMIAGIILFLFPLILHRNKAYLSSKKARLQKKSRIVICVELLTVFLFGRVWPYTTLYAYAIGMTVSVVSRMSAILLVRYTRIATSD